MSIFHSKKSAKLQKTSESFICNFNACSLSFSSKYRLNAHKKSTGHLRKCGRSSSSVGQKKQCYQSILKRYYEQKGDQPCVEEGSEEVESVQLCAEEGSEDLDENKDDSDNDLSENCMVCGQKEELRQQRS